MEVTAKSLENGLSRLVTGNGGNDQSKKGQATETVPRYIFVGTWRAIGHDESAEAGAAGAGVRGGAPG